MARLATLLLLVFWSLCSYGDLRIYFIDVDQADATLIVSPSGHTLLVDSGKNGMGDRLKAVMDKAGVTDIDYFVATHYHEDHYGGIDDLVDLGVAVHHSYDRGDKNFLDSKKKQQGTFVDYESAAGSAATHLMRGETIPLDPEMIVSVISSGGVVLGETNVASADDENDMSISLLIRWHDFQMFVGGDIEAPTETKIAQRDLVRDVDIYQADHHGSHTSSSPAFMQDLSPNLIVISNGSTFKYRHPRQVTLDTYAALDPKPLVLQTNKYTAGGTGAGNVPDQFIADLPPNDDSGTISVVVDDQAHSYSVSYRDQTRTMPIKSHSGVPGLAIAGLLPNPIGSDYDLEAVRLTNNANQSIDLRDYNLIDRSGRMWTLTGSIAPNQTTTIVRHGMPMSLNNDGDEIRLVSNGTTIDTLQYDSSTEGAWITR